jgi:hypothetical protein
VNDRNVLCRPRHRPGDGRVLFRAGQVMQHKVYGYRGVITSWDESCNAEDEWITSMGVDKLPREWISGSQSGHVKYLYGRRPVRALDFVPAALYAVID